MIDGLVFPHFSQHVLDSLQNAEGSGTKRYGILKTGIVFDIQRFSLHNGPGIRTTVFLKGCPLRCWWCHNPESQAPGRTMMVHAKRCIRCEACEIACPQGAISHNGDGIITDIEHCTLCAACVEVCYAGARELVGREMTVAEVMTDVERDVAFFDQSNGGVTFSGGEPLLQSDFLGSLLRACKEREIHTAVDTCGFATWKTLESIRPFVDLFLYDLKLMDSAQHQRFTGVPNELILKNLQMLSKAGHNIILRLPIVPGINDDDENMRQIGAYASGSLGLNRVDILPYHHTAADKYERLMKDYELRRTCPPTDDRMNQIVEILQEFGLQVRIGG